MRNAKGPVGEHHATVRTARECGQHAGVPRIGIARKVDRLNRLFGNGGRDHDEASRDTFTPAKRNHRDPNAVLEDFEIFWCRSPKVSIRWGRQMMK